MVVIKAPNTFYFDFDWPDDVDENLKYEIEFIIQSKKTLAENTRKTILKNYSQKEQNG